MRLKKLEIFGFKSFAEKTKITFEPGVTAIVGPNGCGKSNVADAIKWVLGEQRPTALRGSSMGDVIFNGTNNRDPINIAEVSLTLNNDDKILPVDYGEVTVTRRLHRSGESEYLLNKTRVRLKDVQDLFHGTGVGTVSYSLIEQGKMDLVLSTKPDDRRFIFEEAAGITKYKAKKQEALRKLEHTEANLQRVSDVVNEVNRQIKSIERQARKAEKYKEQYEILKNLEIKNAYHKYVELKNQSTSSGDLKSGLQTKETALLDEIKSMDAQVDGQRQDLNSLEEQLSVTHSKKVEITSQVEKNLSKIDLNNERSAELNERITYLDSQSSELEEKLSKLNQEISKAKEDLEKIESSTTEKNTELNGYEAIHNELTQDIESRNQQTKDSKEELIDLVANETKLNNELAELKANLQNINSRLRRLNIDKEDTLKEKELLDEKKKILDDKYENTSSSLSDLKNEKSSQIEMLKNEREAFDKLKIEIDELQHVTTSLKSKLDFLKDLKERYEGYSNSVKSLLMQAKAQDLPFDGICDSLVNLIKVKDGFEICADISIGSVAQDIVIENEEQLKLAVSHIESKGLGRVNFLILDKINKMDIAFDADLAAKTLGPLSNFIEVNERYAGIIKYVTKDIYVVNNSQDAKKILEHNEIKPQVSIITKAGEIYSKARISAGVYSLSEETSLIGRDAKINKLEEDLKLKTSEVAEKKKLTSEKEESINLLDGKIKSLEDVIHQDEIKKANLESELNTVNNELKKFNDEVLLIDAETEESQEERSHLLEKQAQDETKISEIKDRTHQLEEIISDNEATVRENNKKIQDILVSITQIKTELASIDKLYANKADTCGVIERSIDESNKVLENNRNEKSISNHKIAELKAEIEKLKADNESFGQNLADVENKIASLNSQRESILNTLKEHSQILRQKQEDLNNLRNNLHTYEVKTTESTLKIENLCDRIDNAYHVRLSDVEMPIEENINWPETEREIETLKNKLQGMGAVNLVAIEEHQELRERFDFLSHQKQDLEDARQSLHKAIIKINRTTTTMFKETFEQIRVAFEEFFKLLFGGGSAKLYLVDERNVLESGIEIIARPPGKKLQNISLMSGGEKALCAVALLFAVFKVKPSPFCVLDEIDAPLDESNVVRFTRVLGEFIKTSQFIIITHNKKTINMADVMYGVTMEESGISKIVSVKFIETETSEEDKEPAAVG
jgi:chromosome segregation protein